MCLSARTQRKASARSRTRTTLSGVQHINHIRPPSPPPPPPPPQAKSKSSLEIGASQRKKYSHCRYHSCRLFELGISGHSVKKKTFRRLEFPAFAISISILKFKNFIFYSLIYTTFIQNILALFIYVVSRVPSGVVFGPNNIH